MQGYLCLLFLRAGGKAVKEIEALEKELSKRKAINSIRRTDLNNIKAAAIEEAIAEVGQSKAAFEKPNAHKWMIRTDDLRDYARNLRDLP